MKNTNKLIFLVSITVSIIILFVSIPINASAKISIPLSPAEHKKNIYQFISEIKDAQDNSYMIAQSVFTDAVHDNNQLQLQIDTISSDLQALNERMEDYADIIQNLSEQDRQVRLTFNFLNLVRSNLYTLTLLTRATNDVEKLQLLDEFFRTRIKALDILAILEGFLAKYNA